MKYTVSLVRTILCTDRLPTDTPWWGVVIARSITLAAIVLVVWLVIEK
jgi:hypothetical protein